MTHPKESVLKSKSYQYAIHYLSRYPKTRKELEVKMLEKGFAYDDVQESIDTLEIQNIVDDKKFADSYIYSECVRKGKPVIAIKNKLFQKGIEKDIIEETIEHYADDMAQGMLEKIIKDIDSYKRRGIEGRDVVAKLMRKGYTADQIKEAVDLRDGK